MTENIHEKMNEDDEHLQEEPSSRHLLVALEDLLKRSHPISTFTSKNKYRSKSIDDLLLYRHEKNQSTDTDDHNISTITRTEFDLSGIGCDNDDDNEYDSQKQRSRSAPISPTKIYEKELAAFIDCDQTHQQLITDNFIYNIDLSDSNKTSHSSNSKFAIFFEDDFSSEEINYEPSGGLIHSSLINNCLTIAEENEEELEQLRRDNEEDNSTPIIILPDNNNNQLEDMNNYLERLSTIYESPSPQPEIDDKLIVYDLAIPTKINPESSFPYHSSIIDRTRLGSCFSDACFEPCPNFTNTLTASRLCGTTTTTVHKNSSSLPVINPPIIPPKQHVRTMKVIQSSSTSLSDFISSTPISTLQNMTNYERKTSSNRRILTNGLLLSYCASNPTPRRIQEKLQSDSSSSSSSENLSSSDEQLLSRSDFTLQQEENISPQRKSSSLKSISMTSPQSLSKILYPIDFEIDIPWQQQRSSKVPTSDSGIVIDTRPTSKSSIEENEIDQHETTLNDLHRIKQHIVDIESRLNEAMRELEIEQALIEGEHELVFKQILEASESDQEKIRQLYNNLQLLVERIMAEKNSLRNEISFTERTLRKLEQELIELERQYRSSDEKILFRKHEMIMATRKRYEDLEFQLMELETRCESELEQAEEHFQTEQQLVIQNAKIRQNTLHELDHEQYLVLNQATIEKERLERDKYKFKLLFKQKQIEVNELEQKILEKMRNKHNQQVKFEYIPNRDIELEQNYDYQVKLRDKNRAEERPLTRYLPIRSADFDLRAHIEGAGHLLDTPHISLTSTSCRGYLHKMGGMKFKTWNRRWFVFDRQCHSLFYYQDKTETKLRGCISFQSILEVYVERLQSISLRSPEPREATFIVKTIGRSYYLVAPTVESMRIWVDVMITGAEGNSFAGN